jgi:hypothetical protein
VLNIIGSSRWKDIQEISRKVGLSVGIVQSILRKHLNRHYLCQLLLPKLRTLEQKEAQCNRYGLSAIFFGLVTALLFLASATEKCSTRTMFPST